MWDVPPRRQSTRQARAVWVVVRQIRERPLGFLPRRPDPLDRYRLWMSHPEELGHLDGAVGAEVVQFEQMLGLVRLQLGLLAAQPPLRLSRWPGWRRLVQYLWSG